MLGTRSALRRAAPGREKWRSQLAALERSSANCVRPERSAGTEALVRPAIQAPRQNKARRAARNARSGWSPPISLAARNAGIIQSPQLTKAAALTTARPDKAHNRRM